MLAKQIADAPENVSAIVKRNYLQRSGYGYPRLEIHNRQRIAANRDCKRIQHHYVFVLVDKIAFGNYYLPRSGFFEIKAAQA